MKEMTSKFIIATAILTAPAAGTAVNVSAHAAAAASQPSVSAESASASVAASPQFEPAAADTASRTQSPASAGIVELAEAEPSFTINVFKKTLA
ncbi:hypothetical protein [Paenibacillus sp. UNC499MF]|uniref:hypothetical protein n=1 Tax=Paenibacillus sp. UNC499MF TaxID=1502751 RepID=UPI0008A08717|nr:hypothetical protein [Paenibacillus sp. UNC499MF]SEF85541.1 hypothetical protein SAMN02799616_01234 [Paenibacillus sp. UNC499MF]